jgi:hypothetical protein
LNPDPYGQFFSPYLGMGNNPISSIDPDGGFCFDANGNSIPCPDGYGQYNGPTVEHMNFGNSAMISNSEDYSVTNQLAEVVVTKFKFSNEILSLVPTIPKEQIAVPRWHDWWWNKLALDGTRRKEHNGAVFLVDDWGYAYDYAGQEPITSSGMLEFISGPGAIKFVTYSSETLNTLRSTEVLAQDVDKINSLIKVINSGKISEISEPIYIFVHNGKKYILDGHHRIEAAKKTDKALEVIELYGVKAYEKFGSKVEEILKGLH